MTCAPLSADRYAVVGAEWGKPSPDGSGQRAAQWLPEPRALITSDARIGLRHAIAADLAGASPARLPHPLPSEPHVRVPEEHGPAVKAMLHSVYDQPDAAAVNAQFAFPKDRNGAEGSHHLRLEILARCRLTLLPDSGNEVNITPPLELGA